MSDFSNLNCAAGRHSNENAEYVVGLHHRACMLIHVCLGHLMVDASLI